MTDEEIEKSYMTEEGYEEWSKKVIADIKFHKPIVFDKGNGGNYISQSPKPESLLKIKGGGDKFMRGEYE